VKTHPWTWTVITAGTSLVLTLGFFTAGFYGGAAVCWLVMLGWWMGRRQGWEVISQVGFLVYVLLGAGGLLLGMDPLWGLLAVSGALGSWDLSHWEGAVTGQGRVRAARRLRREHLLALVLTQLMGIGLGLITLNLRFNFRFLWVVLLAVGVVLVVRRLILHRTRIE